MSEELSAREREVVRLISLGCTIGEAAAIMGLSPNTVDNHKSRAMSKLGTDKTALLTRLALKHKISSLKDKLTPAEKRKSGRKNDGWN
jgi:DNA-binding CsgD family transcriptional regulator